MLREPIPAVLWSQAGLNPGQVARSLQGHAEWFVLTPMASTEFPRCLLWLWLNLQPSCSEVTALVCFTCSPLACLFTVVCISLRFAPVCMDRITRDPASTSCLLSNQCLYFLWWLQFHCHSLDVVLFWCFSFLTVIFGSCHSRVFLLVSLNCDAAVVFCVSKSIFFCVKQQSALKRPLLWYW